MRTNIDINDELMAATLEATGKSTKKAAVEEAMRRTVRIERQKQALAKLKGIGWEGDLDAMREGWFRDDQP